jgi:hypothetical protein
MSAALSVEPVSSPVWVSRAYRVAQCLGADTPVKPQELIRAIRTELKCAPTLAGNALAVAEQLGLVQFDGNGWRAVA